MTLRLPTEIELVSLLDETREIGSARAWDAPEVSQLWRYHLHYFDDLSARGAASRASFKTARSMPKLLLAASLPVTD